MYVCSIFWYMSFRNDVLSGTCPLTLQVAKKLKTGDPFQASSTGCAGSLMRNQCIWWTGKTAPHCFNTFRYMCHHWLSLSIISSEIQPVPQGMRPDDFARMVTDRVLACYDGCTELFPMKWGQKEDLPHCLWTTMMRAEHFFGPTWPERVFIIDGCVEQRMAIASMAPATAAIFANLGPHLCELVLIFQFSFVDLCCQKWSSITPIQKKSKEYIYIIYQEPRAIMIDLVLCMQSRAYLHQAGSSQHSPAISRHFRSRRETGILENQGMVPENVGRMQKMMKNDEKCIPWCRQM